MYSCFLKSIIQIPCFNEEKTLLETINDLPKKIEGINKIEYLVTDYVSTDQMIDVVIKYGVDHYD